MGKKEPEKCINPWYQYVAIAIVIVLIMVAIFQVESINASSMNENLFKKNVENNLSVGNLLIASSGKKPNSDVAGQFETCRYFVVIDQTNEENKIFSNNWNSYNMKQVKKFITNNNIEAVITGTISIDTYNILDSMGVAIITGVTGRVDDAVAMYKNGELIPVNYSKNKKKMEPYYRSETTSIERRVVL